MTNPTPPLLHAILANGAWAPTHRRLADIAEISERSVDNKIKSLGPIRGLVGGRPVKLGPGLGMVLSLSLGTESLRGALVDANGELKASFEEKPTPGQLEAQPQELLPRMRRFAAKILKSALDQPELWSGKRQSLRLLGIAVAWPGPVDRGFRPRGSVLRDSQWSRANRDGRIIPLTERVAESFGGPFDVEHSHALNDANAQALSVAFGIARNREPGDDVWRIALVVRVSGGLGAATMMLAPHAEDRLAFIDSRLIAGANGLAGELGHHRIAEAVIEARNEDNPFSRLAPLDYNDSKCSCGRRHHLESFASGSALVRRLKASGYDIADEKHGGTNVIRSLFDGDPDEEQLYAVRDVGRILGAALTGPVIMLDPHSITLTGSLASEELKQGVLSERPTWGHAIGDAAESDTSMKTRASLPAFAARDWLYSANTFIASSTKAFRCYVRTRLSLGRMSSKQ